MQAIYFQYHGDLPKALEHFLECSNWQKAHSIFMTSVAHLLFLSCKYAVQCMPASVILNNVISFGCVMSTQNVFAKRSIHAEMKNLMSKHCRKTI